MSKHRSSAKYIGSLCIQDAVYGALLACILIGLTGCGQSINPVSNSSAASAGTNSVKTAAGLDMIYIPAGEFIMGVDEGPIDAKPAHAVKVDAFLMDETEVT